MVTSCIQPFLWDWYIYHFHFNLLASTASLLLQVLEHFSVENGKGLVQILQSLFFDVRFRLPLLLAFSIWTNWLGFGVLFGFLLLLSGFWVCLVFFLFCFVFFWRVLLSLNLVYHSTDVRPHSLWLIKSSISPLMPSSVTIKPSLLTWDWSF